MTKKARVSKKVPAKGRAARPAARRAAPVRGAARKVRYAVVGLGHIAQNAVLPAFANARKNSELVALLSDDARKLDIIGDEYGVDVRHDYSQYDGFLRSGAVDAVYIALPNAMHRDATLRAAAAGVHVLCEKPMAMSEEDCEAMISACADAKVRLMIAYRLHFERATLKAIEHVTSGKLGEPRIFTSEFTHQVEDEDNIRLKEELGGGTLWDIGIYCINAARGLFRAEPIEVSATTVHGTDERFDEVEEMASVMMRFPDDRVATFTCSFGASDTSAYRVIGTDGDLRVEPAYDYSEGLAHRLTVDGRTTEQRFPKRDQFGAELVYFSDCVLAKREPEPSGREGMADVRVIEAAYRSASRGKAVTLEPFVRTRRPTIAQEIRRPAVKKPKLVAVRAP